MGTKKIKPYNIRAMKHNGQFLLDIFSIIPLNGTLCYIQAPDMEGLSIVSKTDNPALMLMDCNRSSIEILKCKILDNNIQDFIVNISIQNNGITIFEGYDGVKYGIFSKHFSIPQWFYEKYGRNDMYEVSDDW